MGTVRRTAAQALVRFLAAHHVERDGVRHRVFGGWLGILGHGNVGGIGEALYERDEQGMVHTAAGYEVPRYESWWDVAVAEASDPAPVRAARERYEAARRDERSHV
jgi:TPP-dependent trihydroxycyclohexane-1,2-dione (THcHDO) dehydratase